MSENLAISRSTDTAEDVISQLAASEKHNFNMIDPYVMFVGYGIATIETGKYEGQPVIVQRFA